MRRTITGSLLLIIAVSYLLQITTVGYEDRFLLNRFYVENGDMFLNEISKANIEQGTLNRKLIEENNDANLIASQLIAFYNEFVNKTPSI
jgi:hypothetical protein